MEEEVLRLNLMKNVGELWKEESIICEMMEAEETGVTVSTQIWTIICC